jgi:Transposase IS66 family
VTSEEQIISLRRELGSLQMSNAQLREKQQQLVITLLGYQQTIAQLQAQVTELKHELEQRPPAPPAKPPLPPFVKPPRQPKAAPAAASERPPRHHQGRILLTGAGIKIVPHAYAQCPPCAYHLSADSIAWVHQVIDLPAPAPLEVVEHQYIKRLCANCERYYTPAPQAQGIVMGQARFGPRLSAYVGWLRTIGRIPYAIIGDYLLDFHSLDVSEGEINLLLGRVAVKGADTAAQIKSELLAGISLHIDETSWKVNSRIGYIWAMANAAGLRYYEHSYSRAGIVAEQLLKGFKGVFHSDFYAGYNGCEQRRQTCWVHLLRDVHEIEQEHGKADAGLGVWVERLKRLYRVGKWLGERNVGQEVRERWYQKLMSKLRTLAQQYEGAVEHPLHCIAERLLKYERSMFRYVQVEGVVADNNLAERSIRALAVARKVSGAVAATKGSRCE